MRTCPYCGYPNNDDAVYCSKCGRRLDAFSPNGLPAPNQTAKKPDGKADLASVVSIVLGIVGLIFDGFSFFAEGLWSLFIIGLICGVLGLLCAVRNKLYKQKGYGMAGFVLSLLATIGGAIMTLLFALGLILVLA